MPRAGLEPVVLGPKEGLALLNGTQFSTAHALTALFDIERVFQSALITGALSTDAARGSDTPFDPRIQTLRGHRGQIDVAARQQRQQHEIERDTQYLLRESPFVREAFMAKLYAAKDLDEYNKLVEEYREIFAKDVIGRFDLPRG